MHSAEIKLLSHHHKHGWKLGETGNGLRSLAVGLMAEHDRLKKELSELRQTMALV